MKAVKVILSCICILFCLTTHINAQEAIAESVLKTDRDSKDRQTYSKSGKRLHGEYKIFNSDNSYLLASFKDGLLNGTFKEYGKRDILLQQGTYINGEKDGQWTYFYKSGFLEKIEEYNKGTANGTWQYFNPMSKKPHQEEIYKNGERTEIRDYYNEGQLRQLSYYKDGLKSGTWKEFYITGGPFLTTNYSGNQKNGTFQSYYENGQIKQRGTYRNDKPFGEWVSYYESGKTALKVLTDPQQQFYNYESFYENGKTKEKGIAMDLYFSIHDKTLYKYFENGILQSEEQYDLGKKLVSKEYYNNGNLKETATYKNERVTGEYKTYYENGQLEELTTYDLIKRDQFDFIKQMKNGVYRSYYKNGQLKEEGFYKEDKKTGVWKSLKENGQPYFIEIYEDDILIENVSKEDYQKY